MVGLIDEKVLSVCTDLVDTARAFKSEGLAAPQIGENLRIFVIKKPHSDEYRICINPRWQPGPETALMTEGCMSFPGVLAKVQRSVDGNAGYLDETATVQEMPLTGIEAVAFQHELDHLDGILFTERMGKLQKRLAMKRFAKVQRNLKRQRKQLEEMMKSVRIENSNDSLESESSNGK